MKQTYAAILILLAGLLLSPAPARAGDRSILIVHSYHREMPWVVQCDAGLDATLAGKARLHRFYMDTKRLPVSAFAARAQQAWERFRQLRPDLVILGDDNALRLLGPRLVKTGVPAVYFGINNNPREYFGALPPNLGGVLERLQFFPWVRLLRSILPDMENVLVLLDDSTTSRAILDESFDSRRTAQLGRVVIHHRATSDWDRWRDIVSHNTQFDAVILATFHNITDAAGEHVPVERVIEWTSAASPVPVFSYQDYTVHDRGLAGAYVVSGEIQGRQAGEIALAALKGAGPPKNLLPTTSPEGQLFFNRAQLERHGLTLPPRLRDRAIFH